MTLSLTPNAFQPRQDMPKRLTCDGANHSPPLAWTDAPSGVKSFALIIDDPDAPDPKHPRQTWVHWLVYNLPTDCMELPEGGPLPQGARTGRNDWQRNDYGGPCPPIGRHRYVHKLYALDTVLPDLRHPSKGALEKAMQGHVLAQAEMVGMYERE